MTVLNARAGVEAWMETNEQWVRRNRSWRLKTSLVFALISRSMLSAFQLVIPVE